MVNLGLSSHTLKLSIQKLTSDYDVTTIIDKDLCLSFHCI